MTTLEFFGDDWQLSHALARGSEDGVGDGGSNGRHRAFAEFSRRTVGNDDVDFDFRRLIHADYIKVGKVFTDDAAFRLPFPWAQDMLANEDFQIERSILL